MGNLVDGAVAQDVMPDPTGPPVRYLRREQASRYLWAVWGIGRAPATLAKLACTGAGPRYVKPGRIPLYRTEDLDAWVRALLGRTATFAHLEELARICRKLEVDRTGMTEKNRQRLRRFDDLDNVLALLTLPDRVMHDLKTRNDLSREGRRRALHAMAVKMLIATALRVDNLAGLRVDQHLVRTQRRTAKTIHVVIAGEETKSRKPIELVELGKSTVRFLDTYLEYYHPRIAPKGSPWLFPNVTGGRRSTAGLAITIKSFVLRETGILMNVHLFRHFLTKLYLKAKPTDYETARLFLGHSSTSTTARFYAEMRTASAFRCLDDLIASIEDEAGSLELASARDREVGRKGMSTAASRPRLRHLRLEQWPAYDQAAWAAAMQPGDLLDPGGIAIDWAESTRRNVIIGYRIWLNWLEERGWLDPALAPEARISRDRLSAYRIDLQDRVAPFSVYARVQCVGNALWAMTPHLDWHWILRGANRIRASAAPARTKRLRLQAPDRLVTSGLNLMGWAENAFDSHAVNRATAYRDGLLIAFLAHRPIRAANLASIVLDRHLARRGADWWLLFPGSETKNRQLLEMSFPRMLVPHLDRYLSVYRPVLADGGRHRDAAFTNALWISRRGIPFDRIDVNRQVTQRTRAAFGMPVNPHLFRDCVATGIAVSAPEHVGIVQSVLGHTTLATSERYYNQASSLAASRRYDEMVETLCKKASAAERARRRRSNRLDASTANPARPDPGAAS